MSHAMLIQQTFATAMQYHRGGRLSEAESLYWQILQADSNNADALHMLGVLAHQTGRQQVAVDMISLAIAQNGQVPAFHNNLGNAYAAIGKWQDAETSYRRALDRKRDYAEAHYNLGGALRAQDKLDEAAASYDQALSLRPNHAETYLNLSNALQAQGKLQEAAEACQRAISSKPDLAAAHNNLGNILAAQNRFEAAVTVYSRAACHTLVATQAVPQLPGRNGYLSRLPGLLRLYNSLAGAPLWSADHYTRGQYLRQRLAAGLLRQVGATDGIALSREQYVAAAVGWANECRDTDRWAARRVELRRAAPRADGNRAAILAFEQKLREAFQGAESRGRLVAGCLARRRRLRPVTQYLQCRAMMLSASSWRPDRGAGSKPLWVARSARLARLRSPLVIRLPNSPLHPL
jgi:Tfp pilus assembly protein PilF